MDRNSSAEQVPQRVSQVAPHAGAWIETSKMAELALPPHVAPHAGAWIETFPKDWAAIDALSPLTQGRGSKLDQHGVPVRVWRSPLTQGRGSKRAR